MINSSPPRQFHSDTNLRRQQLLANGVNLRLANGELVNSENVYGYGKSALHLFASYVVDWGSGPAGMQTNRPHRRALMNQDFEQFGGTITAYAGNNFGPLVNTNVLVNIESPPSMAVGAIFEDKNHSGWYESGEGIGGATIVFAGPSGTFSTQSLSAGGYQIELPPGSYTATATGGGMLHPVILGPVVMGATNLWKDLIYDPQAIPPDASEPNNSTATASELSGRDQSLSNRSIHTMSDIDFYRFSPASHGSALFSLQFSHAAGNIDLQLLNASGSVLAASTGTANTETIVWQVTRGATYFLRVYTTGGAVNRNYALSIDAPEAVAPVAKADSARASNLRPTIHVDILANDSDADGDHSRLIPQLSPAAPAAFALTAEKRLTYTAPENFAGFARTSYSVIDDQGLSSAPATIEVFVVNFATARPWQNQVNPVDVNGDGLVSGLDVLLVINEINAREARPLPTTDEGFDILGFVDSSGNGFVSGLDALLIVNAINAQGLGEGEERPAIPPATADYLGSRSRIRQALLPSSSGIRLDPTPDSLRLRWLLDTNLPCGLIPEKGETRALESAERGAAIDSVTANR